MVIVMVLDCGATVVMGRAGDGGNLVGNGGGR